MIDSLLGCAANLRLVGFGHFLRGCIPWCQNASRRTCLSGHAVGNCLRRYCSETSNDCVGKVFADMRPVHPGATSAIP